ncbi:MAG: protein kinase [Gemmatimonadota bacterium]|jgi:serine/threonine-protein kinase
MTDPVARLNAALERRYAVESEIGEGGMATVYLAEDLRHHRKVALKVLKPELAAVVGAERFLAEIETTANLQHPHILPLYDSGEADSFLFYVMPYVEGETLRQRLDREKQLPVDEAVRIATAVAGALDYAHRHGVVHRDVKPGNIMMQDGQPVVGDFGIALAVGAAGGARLTETGLSVGTPYYMSPEQATGDQTVGPATDIYALGAVLYELLTGDPPYMGSTAQAVLGKILQGVPVSATTARRSVPANVDAALRKALEKLPADRFTGAQEFAKALADPGFRHGTESPTALGGRRWKDVAVVATMLAGVFAVALAWALLRPAAPLPVTRYRLTFTAGGGLRPLASRQFALAPDGSWLVYTGPGSDTTKNQLWVKARDRVEATPLAGTDGAESPFVSPDGQWIAFDVGGELRKVPVGGGSATTIADTVWASLGGVWLDDGTVAYTDAAGRLRRVPAAGGTAEVLYPGELGHGGIPVDALPGGRGILFLDCTLGCTPVSELWVLDGRSGEARRLLPDVASATYLDGRLIFVRRDGSVFGVAFDLGRLALQGNPVPLFEGVGVNATAQFALAASGELAYLAGVAATGGWEAVWVSREGQAVPVDTTWIFQQQPLLLSGWALSPDGTRLAIGIRTGENDDIWIKELDRGPLSRLTFSDLSDLRPRWTPDGRTVTFISNRAGNYDLYARRADGTGADSLVLDLEAPIYEAVTSLDDQWLVPRTTRQATGRDILALRVGRDTVPRPLLTEPYSEAAPALSPDGRWLAYESSETERHEIFVRPFPEVQTGKWQVSTGGGTSPVWAHSGRELFFINGNRELVSQAVLPGETLRRGEQRVLFAIGSQYGVNTDYTYFDISPDDRRFLMVRLKGAGVDETPALIVVENWMEEVKARVPN